MDSLIGIVGDGYVLIAADSNQNRSVVRMKGDEDKILFLDSHKLLAAAGEAGDRVQFCEFIQKNIALYELRNGYELSVHAAAHFTRGELAYALRSSPYFVNLLLGGWDKENGASLYFLDYLASMNQMNYAVHGYASYFLYSLLDRHYKPKMSLEEGMQLLDLCFRELETRFVINTRNYIVKVADKDGVRVLRDASAAAEPAAQPKPLHSA